ncbi:hypothetical protein BH11PSE7_BH11PSE7_37330 [soil metagenome]
MDTSSSSTSGNGIVLALWNDIEPTRSAEYERWHTLEHVPERVWVPGFRAGTRYLRHSGPGARYFTLYEIDSPDALASADYDDLVRNPTPWSASMRPSFSNFLRLVYTVAGVHGKSRGAAVLVVRAVWDAAAGEPTAQALEAFAAALLKGGSSACVMRVEVGVASAAGPQAMANVDGAPEGADRIFMLHTSNAAHLTALSGVLASALAALPQQPLWQFEATYLLASRVEHAQVASPARPAPRLDLMP